jgi:hypothetical protein
VRFLELLIQGIRQFPSSHRITFDPNKNWIFLGSGEGKTTLSQLIRAAFDNPFFLRIQESLLPRKPLHESSRFALTFTNGKETYRILRDVRTSQLRLYRLDPGTGKYLPHLESAEKIEGFLADEFDFPGAQLYTTLCLFGGEGGGEEGIEFFEEGEEAKGATEKEILNRLEALEEDKALLQNVRELQFELDGYQDEKFKLEKEIEQLLKPAKEMEEIEAELKKTEKVEELPLRLVEKVKNYERFQRITHDKLGDFLVRIEEKEKEIESLKARPRWHRDPPFLGISLVTVAGFILPPLLKLYALAIVGFLGLGGIGWMIRRYSQLNKKIAEEIRLLNELKEQKEKFERESSSEIGIIESLTRELNLISPKDIVRLIEERKKQKELLEKRKKEWEHERAQEKITELKERRNALEKKIHDLSHKLEEVALAEKDVGMIEREIEKLKRELAILREGGRVGVYGSGSSNLKERTSNPFPRILEAGIRLSRKPQKSFYPAVNQILQRTTPYLFGSRLKTIEIGEKGEVFWLDPEKGEPLPREELHPSMIEATEALLRLAILYVGSDARSLPCVWDEPFPSLDDLLLGKIGAIAEKFSPRFQIVLFSGRKALGAPMGNPIPIQRV